MAFHLSHFYFGLHRREIVLHILRIEHILTSTVSCAGLILLGDGNARLAQHSLGALLGDQQVQYKI